jgi:hypothetical protein
MATNSDYYDIEFMLQSKREFEAKLLFIVYARVHSLRKDDSLPQVMYTWLACEGLRRTCPDDRATPFIEPIFCGESSHHKLGSNGKGRKLTSKGLINRVVDAIPKQYRVPRRACLKSFRANLLSTRLQQRKKTLGKSKED